MRLGTEACLNVGQSGRQRDSAAPLVDYRHPVSTLFEGILFVALVVVYVIQN